MWSRAGSGWVGRKLHTAGAARRTFNMNRSVCRTLMATPASSAARPGRALAEIPPSIGRLKMLVRRRIRGILEATPPASLALQGEQVLQHLTTFAQYAGSARVSCYRSMGAGELPTDGIISNLLDTKKKVFLPYVHTDTEPVPSPRMEMLALESWEAFLTDLVPVSFSLSSGPASRVFQFDPARIAGLETARPQDLDLILLPGLAFDRYGHRLGHGKGYYDEYLNVHASTDPNHRQDGDSGGEKQPILVGICLREQLFPAEEYIPTLAHDRRLDFVVSPDGVFARIRRSPEHR